MSKNTEKKRPSFLRRWFLGNNHPSNVMDVEEIVSPTKQVLRNFAERKLAVFALFVVIAMFIFVFVAPLFMPKYYDAYTEVTQKDLPPNFSMLSVPKEMADDVKMIDSFGSFSVGLSNAGDVYVWGVTKIGNTGFDVADIPQEVLDANIVMVTAGFDHIIAIDDNGKVYGWGNNRLGQYGTSKEFEENPNIAMFPQELADNGVDVANIKKLTAGYQCSAILMNDGTLHLWGNTLTYANVPQFLNRGGFEDIDFTLNYIVGLQANRSTVYTGTRGLYDQVRANVGDATQPIAKYLNGRKIAEIIPANSNICLLLDDGSICFTGDFPADPVPLPTLNQGEYFVDVDAGAYHYVGATNLGNVYSWGGNILEQASTPTGVSGVNKVFAGTFQSYAVDENDSLVEKWGLKGYLFGTDKYGADVFQRVVNGGKMTMTIGAVAVIISSIIGIIVGCLSGYFGGKLDIILMRITEGFSAIPFIPFALTLSAVLAQVALSETMRIFIIMCILGVLSWTGLARLVRGQVLSVRENEYVVAAQAMGVKSNKIAFKHILPNVISVILVNLTLNFATCMLTESSLSYLGFGVAYPRPTWGNMLFGANNATVIKNYWWQWLFPAIFLAITTICINIVGDTLRDVMDPKSSSR